MRLSYDPEADSILLTIGDPDAQSESWAEPADGVIIDFDRDKHPIWSRSRTLRSGALRGSQPDRHRPACFARPIGRRI